MRTQCLCNRLAYLGSDFFIVPWAMNIKDTTKLFLRVTNNPAGVSLLASLFGFYILTCVWAWRKDQADMQKVVITLYGSEGQSEPHHLCDPQKAVFERGELDVFLLTTQSSLGESHGLRLWHDNSGASPSCGS